jgi:hypothetical protein
LEWIEYYDLIDTNVQKYQNYSLNNYIQNISLIFHLNCRSNLNFNLKFNYPKENFENFQKLNQNINIKSIFFQI